jgi:hypothetical protein
MSGRTRNPLQFTPTNHPTQLDSILRIHLRNDPTDCGYSKVGKPKCENARGCLGLPGKRPARGFDYGLVSKWVEEVSRADARASIFSSNAVFGEPTDRLSVSAQRIWRPQIVVLTSSCVK